MSDVHMRGRSNAVQRLERQIARSNQPSVRDNPNLDRKATSGLLTGRELIAKMGGPPKNNWTFFGRVTKTNSVAYNKTLQSLTNYQRTMSDFGIVSPGMMDQSQIAQLKSQLRGVTEQVDAYLEKHQNDTDKNARRGVMSELKAMAQKELTAIDDAMALSRTDGAEELDLQTVMALARGGLHDLDCLNFDLRDSEIDRGLSRDNFGSGAFNSVSLLHYNDGEVRVVKPLVKSCAFEALPSTAQGDLRIDHNDQFIGARNIASAKIAALLGVGHLIPKPDIIIHNGVACLAMKLAPGEETSGHSKTLVTDPKIIEDYEGLKPEELADTHFRKIDGQWWRIETGHKILPYTDSTKPEQTASLQKEMLDLQAVHALLSQTDAHVHNIFVQVDGTTCHVTGIDNDLCLGENRERIRPVFDPQRKLVANYHGMPPLISRGVYDELINLTEDVLRHALKGLPDGVVEDACERLTVMQDYARELEIDGRIVDDFQTWTKEIDGRVMNVSEYLVESPTQNYVQRGALCMREQTNFPLDSTKHH